MTITVTQGDCVAVLQARTGPLFDAVICDPPYHLTSIVERFGKGNAAPAQHGTDGAFVRASRGFMGKEWDGGDVAFRPETWRAIYDQMKPGAHLIAFSGTRTYHRMAVAIEDAGFEIRQMLAWTFGSGFPKSHNVFKALSAKGLCCTCPKTILSSHHVSEQDLHNLCASVDANGSLSGGAEFDVQPGVQGGGYSGGEDGKIQAAEGAVRDMRSANSSAPSIARSEKAIERPLLQQPLLGDDARRPHANDISEGACGDDAGEPGAGGFNWPSQSGVERRGDVQTSEGKLYRGAICASAGMGETDGASGRVHIRASARDGADVRIPIDASGGRSSSRPQSGKQRSGKFGAMADKRGSSAWGGWPVCPRCSKPIIPEGLGTDVKPAFEPICLARKPLSEGSIAANVLAHGTGAINIDACRVDSEKATGWAGAGAGGDTWNAGNMGLGKNGDARPVDGRFPANILHDGSDEVEAGFPDRDGMAGGGRRDGLAATDRTAMGAIGNAGESIARGDSGSAARFFYSAKAGPLDRLGSEHPTVKPVDVMRWLVRLVTPPGGLILDPFAGSGTTGIAALAEGFDAELIDLEPDHVTDIETKLAHLRGEGSRIVERHLKRKAARAKPAAGGLFD